MIKTLPLIFLIVLVFHNRASSVEIRGNKQIADDRILSTIKSVSSDDSTSLVIGNIYRKMGYFQARVERISILRSGEKEIFITEGQAARIESLLVEVPSFGGLLTLDDLVSDFTGRVAAENNFNAFAELCIERFSENGMPYASGEWTRFRYDSPGNIIATFRVLPGPITYLKGIRFGGVKRTRPETLNRLLNIRPGSRYSESDAAGAEKRLERMPYIEVAGPFRIEPFADGDSCVLVFNLRELPSSRFDGAGGLARVGQRSTFLGRADLEFGDILGTGRAFGFLWNRKDKSSSELGIRYYEPFILNSRIDLEIGAFQFDRDTTFIQTGARLGLIHNLGASLTGRIDFTLQRTVPEPGSDVMSSTGRSVKVAFDYDRTDYPENPTLGYTISTEVDYKYRTNKGITSDSLDLPTRLTSAGMQARHFLKLGRRFVFASAVSGWGIVSADGITPVDELRFLGGFESLRGYTERRFPAYRYFVVSLEPRLIAGPRSRLYIFSDMAEIKGSQSRESDYEFFPGFGIGAVAPTVLGQFRLEIAWGKTGFPSDAILNLGIAGRF